MKDQLKTIREALELATDGPIVDRDGMIAQALAALTQLEAMVGRKSRWRGFHPSATGGRGRILFRATALRKLDGCQCSPPR